MDLVKAGGLPPPLSMPQTNALITRLESLIMSLTDTTKRDDVKNKDLREISENFEELSSTPACAPLLENLIRAFIRLLQDTHPQFISENNTLQLRKLVLELLLRMSTSEVLKNYSKQIQVLLLRIAASENEENALIIIKILTDHIKAFRPAFYNELSIFFTTWKNAYREMFRYASEERMFLSPDYFEANCRSIEDFAVTDALKNCYLISTLSFKNIQPQNLIKYSLIPRAIQSVRVLAEMSVFLLFLIQSHRQHLFNEIAELLPLFVRYVNIVVPKHLRAEKTYNKELVDEFHNSQVRALTFIAYTTRQSQLTELIAENAMAITNGINQLFDGLNGDVIQQRRDLLLAIKYFFQCEMRAKFIGIIPRMTNDSLLIGTSFTSREQLRNHAYTILADILHHVRMSLPFVTLTHIYFIASRNLHDPLLLPFIQTMYGKLMMNLVEPLIGYENQEGTAVREILLCAIDSFVRKTLILADYHLPLLFDKYRTAGNGPPKKNSVLSDVGQLYWQETTPFSLNDCKNMIRFILQPMKMIIAALNEINNGKTIFTPNEVELLSKFFVYALKCLDVFMIGSTANTYQKSMNSSGIRSKEEKEAIDAFISVYSTLDPTIFYEIMNKHVEFFVDRIFKNHALQSICNSFFIHQPTASKMGTVLVQFLLKRLPEMGLANERASLYLKLFKLMFSAVSCSQQMPDCENMLKPFLHDIVQNSMQLALRCRESTNYFLLLRVLFRSIGSGAHDLLYQEFLPLLPSILQQLNRLQNCSHRQTIHELFVELCLTVPVRLSSLLPYLPLLMDPLVCALYGSPTLVKQGLRTLELCVDNLQPEYFYDHMAPVRAALLQGLWRTVASLDYQSAFSAFRILGKFAGSSRKVLLDPRSVDYDRSEYSLTSSSVMMEILFGHKSARNLTAETNMSEMECCELMEAKNKKEGDENAIPFWCNVPLKHLVESATALLRCAQNSEFMFNNVIGVNTVGSCGAHSGANSNASHVVPKAQALEIIRLVLLSAISSQELASLGADEFRAVLEKGVETAKMRLESGNFPNYDQQFYHEHDKASREFFAIVLTGLFCAVVNNDLRPRSFTLFREVIRYLTTQAILEFGNADCCVTSSFPYLSVSVLVDALTATLADPCKDFCHTVVAAMKFMIDTAVTVFGSEKVFYLPFFEYLLNEISLLCYRREWYSRLGGCTALRFIIENYPSFFVRKHASQFLTAFIEVNAGLADEVSSGVLDFSAKSVDAFLPVCFSSVDEAEMEQMIDVFMAYIVEHLDDSEALLRDECLRILHGISRLTKRSVSQLIGNRVLSSNVLLSTLENSSPSDVVDGAQASDKVSRDEFFARVDELTNSLADLISPSLLNQQSQSMNTTSEASSNRFDSAALLQVLQQLWTIMERVNAKEWVTEGWSADAKIPRLFRLIRQLWTSDAFFASFSIRIDFAGDELARCAPLVEAAKYDVPVYCARILLAYLKALLLRSSTAKVAVAENADSNDGVGGQTSADAGQASSTSPQEAEDIDQLSIDLVYDLMHVFCSKFISNFTFVRSFVEEEIIPAVSLEWRRKAFKKVIVHLRSLEQARFRREVSQTTVSSVQLVRFMQFIVMPCIHYAFEKHDVDLVVGSAPNLDVKKDDNNVVSILGEYIEMICAQNKEASAGASKSGRGDSNAHCMSDAMTIVMYQFCVMLVQKCPAHIHDNMRKQQQDGSRLRSFMLFGWPCLQANFSRDLTEKYAGHLLIANIIDKFAINRKIVLQVLNSLVMAHLPDYKEIVRKALDILIPAVPRRMDDGYVQLYTIVKKAIVEESRSSAQVAIHCLNIIIRHYKVFYFVRHQLSHVLLSTLQRLLSSQFGYELRRLVVDVCDMFIKWEQERQRIITAGSALEQAASTSPPSQTTTSGNVGGEKSAILSGGASTPTIGESAAAADSQRSSSPGQMSTASATTVASGGGTLRSAPGGGGVVGGQSATSTGDDVHRPMEKAIIDNILLLLVRIATTSSSEMNSGNVSNSNLEQISKRSIMLLRVALKLTVFGQVSSVKSHWFEKHLTLPNPEQFSDQNAINHQLNQVHVTLDVLSNIINYMSQQSIVDVFRQLQRPIILCLNSSNTQIVRSTYSVISKLLDKTNSSSNGLLEFEMLNQAINKYIYDSFASYYGSMASPSQSTFMTITLLKIIYSIQPAYLDTVCLAPFLKTIQRLVRDCQQPPPSVAGGGGNPSYADANKVYSDILCVCLEMVAARLSYFSFEAKRSITQLILVPLIDKSSTDRILEIVIRCINALITGGDPSQTSGGDSTSGGATDAQPPPPVFSSSTTSVVNNLGIGLLIRMCSALESRILANGDLLKSFLLTVLYVFESGRFDESSDIVSKLNNCFYWGLCCNDNELRLRCFNVLQKHFPVDIYDRMLYSIGRQNWQPMGSYYWITHLVHLLLLSDCPAGVIPALSSSSGGSTDDGNASEFTTEKTKSLSQQRTRHRLRLTNCATFSSFWERVVRQIRPSIVVAEVKVEENNPQQPSQASASDDLYSVVRAPPFPDDSTTAVEQRQQQNVPFSSSSSQQEIKMEVDAIDEGGCSSSGCDEGSGAAAESTSQQSLKTLTQVSTAADGELESGNGNTMDVDEVTEEGVASPGLSSTKQLTSSGMSKATGTPAVVAAAATSSSKAENNRRPIDAIFDAHHRLLNLANHGDQLSSVVTNVADFIHYDWKVAKAIFIEFFRSFWSQLGTAERDQLSALAQPFLASTMMLTQKDSLLSVAATFLEAFVYCSPKIDFRSSLLRHLGETHNCHHFAIRLLEERAARIRLASKEALASTAANSQLVEELEVLDNLAELYTTLDESDQHWAVWKRRAYFDKTTNCLALFNQGEYTQARDSFEKFVAILNERLSRGVPPTVGDQTAAVVSEVSPALHTEVQLWERYWVDSCRELGDWSTLLEFANNEEIADCGLLMDAAWHLDEWPLLNDCVQQVDASADRKLYGRTSLYKLMYSVTTMDISKDTMDKSLLDISKYLINEWRKLPRLVSMSHVKLLGDAQWVHEVSEASSILHAAPGNPMAQSNNIKHLMKSWRNRPLAQLDPISTWSKIFKWRYQHYVSLKMDNALHTSQHSTFITHTLVQSQLNLARLLRRSNQLEMALNVLNTLHELPAILTLDAQLKIYEHAKCLIKLASLGGGAVYAAGNPSSSSSLAAGSKLGVVMPDALYEALEMIESTQLQFMKREQVARILLTKGILLSKLEKNEDASQAFSQAALLEECTTTSSPVWKHWGRHMENIFLSHPSESAAMNFGMQAIACFMECAKNSSQLKSRTHLARVFWLLKVIWSCGAQLESKQEELLRENIPLISPSNWLFWVNEIIADIRQRPGTAMSQLLYTVAEAYPQQVFYALRMNLKPLQITERIQKVCDGLPAFTAWNDTNHYQRPENNGLHGIDANGPPTGEANANGSDAMDATASSTASSMAAKAENNGGDGAGNSTESRSTPPSAGVAAATGQASSAAAVAGGTAATSSTATLRQRRRSGRCGLVADWQQKLLCALETLCARQPSSIRVLNQLLNELDAFAGGDKTAEDSVGDRKPANALYGRRGNPLEKVLYWLRDALNECNEQMFVNIGNVANEMPSRDLHQRFLQLADNVEQLVGGGERVFRLPSDFEALKSLLACLKSEFDVSEQPKHHLHKMASFLRYWLQRIVERLKASEESRRHRLAAASHLLGNFRSKMASIDVFNGPIAPRITSHIAQIAHFMPIYHCFVRHYTVRRLLMVRSLNGRAYSYFLEKARLDEVSGSIFQLFSMLNTEFSKDRATSQRLIQFAMPKVLHVGRHARLTECGSLAGTSSQLRNGSGGGGGANSSLTLWSALVGSGGGGFAGGSGSGEAFSFHTFIDVFDEMLRARRAECGLQSADQLTPDSSLSLEVVDHYYARLMEQRHCHKTLLDLFNEIAANTSAATRHVSGGDGVATTTARPPSAAMRHLIVPKDLLAEWMTRRYPDASCLWTSRRNFATSFALLGFVEFAMFLSSMSLNELVVDVSTAQLFFGGYHFDLSKKICDSAAGKVVNIELDATRPVAFRISANIAHFLDISIDGHFSGALISIARCLNGRGIDALLRPILWDVFFNTAIQCNHERQAHQEQCGRVLPANVGSVIDPVKRSVDTIVQRIKLYSQLDVASGSSTTGLLVSSQHADNLCRMDPNWHPWF